MDDDPRQPAVPHPHLTTLCILVHCSPTGHLILAGEADLYALVLPSGGFDNDASHSLHRLDGLAVIDVDALRDGHVRLQTSDRVGNYTYYTHLASDCVGNITILTIQHLLTRVYLLPVGRCSRWEVVLDQVGERVVPAHVRSELAIDIAHDEVPVWLLGEPVGCKVELRWNAGRERDGGRELRGVTS